MSAAPQPIAIPSLDEIVTHPERAMGLPQNVVLSLCSKLLLAHQALLVACVNQSESSRHGRQIPSVPDDRLLNIKEAAVKLGVSTQYLYRKGAELPFTVRMEGKRGKLMFSNNGIERFIKQGGSRQ